MQVIALDGPDCVGKSTTIAHINRILKGAGYKTFILISPDHQSKESKIIDEDIANLSDIKEFCSIFDRLDGKKTMTFPKSISYFANLYASGRNHVLFQNRSHIHKMLDYDKSVILMDRSWISNMLYQSYQTYFADHLDDYVKGLKELFETIDLSLNFDCRYDYIMLRPENRRAVDLVIQEKSAKKTDELVFEKDLSLQYHINDMMPECYRILHYLKKKKKDSNIYYHLYNPMKKNGDFKFKDARTNEILKLAGFTDDILQEEYPTD